MAVAIIKEWYLNLEQWISHNRAIMLSRTLPSNILNSHLLPRWHQYNNTQIQPWRIDNHQLLVHHLNKQFIQRQLRQHRLGPHLLNQLILSIKQHIPPIKLHHPHTATTRLPPVPAEQWEWRRKEEREVSTNHPNQSKSTTYPITCNPRSPRR